MGYLKANTLRGLKSVFRKSDALRVFPYLTKGENNCVIQKIIGKVIFLMITGQIQYYSTLYKITQQLFKNFQMSQQNKYYMTILWFSLPPPQVKSFCAIKILWNYNYTPAKPSRIFRFAGTMKENSDVRNVAGRNILLVSLENKKRQFLLHGCQQRVVLMYSVRHG